MNPVDLRLYLVCGSDGLSQPDFLSRVEQALRAGVTCLQLREKDTDGRDFFLLAQTVNQLAQQYHVPLLIDDRVDIAMAVGAAGVHVGQSDIPVSAARQLMGPGAIIGATAKTLPQARQAVADGADYLGVGAIYPTTTKVKTVLTPVETLREICAGVPVPAIAIGGLDADNLDVLQNSGIAGIAVVSAIMKSPTPANAARRLREKVEQIL